MTITDTVEITQLIQRWGQCRDQGFWDELAATFIPDGTIAVTWYAGPIAGFIDRSRRMFVQLGPRGKHLIGQPVVMVRDGRAFAETNIQILGRAEIGGVMVDNTSYARFLDRLVKHDGVWRIAHRVAVYEKDRLDPVTPGADFDRFMAETDFSTIPEPYRFIGYRLMQKGHSLQPGILCDGSPEAIACREDCLLWLSGAS